MGHLRQTKPIVSAAKMRIFLLSATLAIIISLGIFTRPTQAEILNPVTPAISTAAGCLLNIGVCPPPAINPKLPTATVTASPNLAGGTASVVTITGKVTGDSLTSYVLMVNDSVVQQANSLTTKSAAISTTWNVSSPNKVPSGIYTVTLDATDRDGVVSRASTKVEVDNDGPTVLVTGGDTIVKSGSISPTMVATDPHEVTSFKWTADPANPSNPAVLSFDETSAEPIFTPTATNQNPYIFYVDVTDGLGNVAHGQFKFSYAQALATVPLPTTQNPTDALVNQTPSTPAVTQGATRPTVQSGPNDVTTNTDAGVLGSTVTSPEQAQPTKIVASIAPTANGWSIFGLLWYWWIVIAGILFTAWLMVKKFVAKRIPQSS
jgi:hypothetical protein